jgi:hypothetical protein
MPQTNNRRQQRTQTPAQGNATQPQASPAQQPNQEQAQASPEQQARKIREANEKAKRLISKTKQPGVNPSLEYVADSDEIRAQFVKSTDELFDLEGYLGVLNKDINNRDALHDFIKKGLKYIPNEEETLTKAILEHPEITPEKINQILSEQSGNAFIQSPSLALEQAERVVSQGYMNTALFVQNNRAEILEHLTAEQLFSIVNRVPLYKTYNDEHDAFVLLREKLTKMQKAQEEGTGLEDILKADLKEISSKIAREQIEFMNATPEMSSSLYQSIIEALQKAHATYFVTEGKLDKNKLKAFLEDNYKVIEDIIKNDDVPEAKDKDGNIMRDSLTGIPYGEKFERWNNNLKQQYVELARELHSTEKQVYKRKADEEKEDRKARHKRRGIKT